MARCLDIKSYVMYSGHKILFHVFRTQDPQSRSEGHKILCGMTRTQDPHSVLEGHKILANCFDGTQDPHAAPEDTRSSRAP